MLQFSANLSLLFTEVPLIQRFELAKQAGFQAIEIQFPYELSLDEWIQQLAKHQLKLVLINVPAGDLMQGGDGLACVPNREHEFRQAVFQAVRYASVLNVPSINILAGRQPIHADLLPCLETLAKNLHFASVELDSVGIRPVFEIINGIDMPRFMIQTMAQAQEMLEAVRHPALKIQFDCYHQAMMQEQILQNLQENMQHIGHIQFADCPNRHEPDTGRINFAEIFEFIKSSDYQGYTGAEYRPLTNTTDSLGWFKKFVN
jgi:hydroxypyruvate isomerase